MLWLAGMFVRVSAAVAEAQVVVLSFTTSNSWGVFEKAGLVSLLTLRISKKDHISFYVSFFPLTPCKIKDII